MQDAPSLSGSASVPLSGQPGHRPPRPSTAIAAFDGISGEFDGRYGEWLSVAAQRRAVRRVLERAFPAGSRLIEVGGGTGEDARWLAERGREVLMTDGAPGMVMVARQKLRELPNARCAVLAAEDLENFSAHLRSEAAPLFDGAYSNFAALNCVDDLRPVARGLAGLVRPGGQVVLVVFGALPPGEILVQAIRGAPRAAFRRLKRGPVAARIGGRPFAVRYHRPGEIVGAFADGFRLKERRGVGVLVPPSAAEPWISSHPRLLRVFEQIDSVLERPLASLGDHVLYRFERTEDPVRPGGR